ncbi:MAG TPA: type I-U CRISPR-associated helicase/endonuclease Cas3 [Planctomycetaceae bacterium]|nr:type I-U CRISPR-associated helicase/endonuclease Cas3 [Planctomycetaceae bacterium]
MTFDFDKYFAALTGSLPFPWQRKLFERFVSDHAQPIPSSCQIPTGLGKTSVVAIWLLALIARRERIPRRLVYVVNRRTVVDQTTDEVVRLRNRLLGKVDDGEPPITPEDARLLAELAAWLKEMCADQAAPPLAISTLRGQFADNKEWSADPSRPAIIVGTVDMIGSRLLFSGYGVGFKARPLHAGFLGQDALLVHDEAHLEPAFQQLLETIERQQRDDERSSDVSWPKLRVMELTATSRGDADVFRLSDEDMKNAIVRQRVSASKTIHLHPEKDSKKLADDIAALALQFKNKGSAVLVFVRTVEDVMKVKDRLEKEKQLVETLTGTRRGKERDELVKTSCFKRFLPEPPADAAEGTVYLVCTSAGEVGVNISADHLVCDLSTFESMAQRFGRVNRFGKSNETVIHIVHPEKFDSDKPLELRREKTLALMQQLNGDGSPKALGDLHPDARAAAFAPTPEMLTATDIHFDAWSLTSIRERMPGRPPVEPYLHGIADWDPPETHVAWREEVERIVGPLLVTYPPEDLLDDYPLLPHELLRDRTDRVAKHLAALLERFPHAPAWLMNDDGTFEPERLLSQVANKDRRDRLNGRTVLLPPFVGGLRDGLLDGAATETDLDVSDELVDGKRLRQRLKIDPQEESPPEPDPGMRRIRQLLLPKAGDEVEDGESIFWNWYEKPESTGLGTLSAGKNPVAWHIHNRDVDGHAERILKGLSLPADITAAVLMAAKYHDYGKHRAVFQTMLGNRGYDQVVWAKSGRRGGRIAEHYRHEFGSLFDVQKQAEFQALTNEQRDLVLHLIAAHHGRARPHFSRDEAFDPNELDTASAQLAAEIPQRFARLQRSYGRWGLAYLESLLRAADYAASMNPSEDIKEPRS